VSETGQTTVQQAVVGQQISAVRDLLTAEGFFITRPPVLEHRGQRPGHHDRARARTKQPLGLTITLVISQGPAAIVPDVVHRTQGAAMALIEAAHLNVGVTPVTIPASSLSM